MEKNRLIAYYGSPVHFYKSLINKTIKKEGFIINQFKRVLNTERPTEEEIENARKIISVSKGIYIDFSEPYDTNVPQEIANA